MPNDDVVRCDFQAGGISQAKEAFRTMEQSLLRLEKLATKYHDVDEKGAIRAAKTEQASAQARTKSAVAFADARTEIAKREEKKRLDGQKVMFAGLDKLEKEHTRTAAAEAQKRERAEAASAKAVSQRRSQMGASITGGLKRSAGMGMGQYGGLTAGMGVGIGGVFAVADATKNYMSSDAKARALGISMYQGDGPDNKEQQAWLARNGKNGRFDKNELLTTAATMSAASGVDKTQLLGGLQKYVALSSDWQAIADPKKQGPMTELAKMATASGTDFGDIMGAAGSMRMSNPNLTPEKMTSLMRGILGQGKVGAIELNELASHASRITSTAGMYSGAQEENQTKLLGLSQIARRNTGDTAEAATATARFAQDVAQHANAAQTKGGYKGYDPIADHKTGALKDPSEILAQMFDQSKGDFSTFGLKDSKGNKGFGLGLESIHVAQGEIGTYKAAKELAAAGGAKEADAHKAGVEAVRADVKRVENATYSKGDVEKDYAEVVEGAGKKIEMATARIKQSLEVKMAPVVERLADSFVKNEQGLMRFVEAVGKAAEYMLENPVKGIGIVLAASVTKEVALAGIGAAMKQALELDAVRSASGKFAGAVGAAGLAVAALLIGMEMIDAAFRTEAKAVSDAAVAGGHATQAQIDLTRGGGGSPAEKQAAIAKASTALTAARQSIASQKEDLSSNADDEFMRGNIGKGFKKSAGEWATMAGSDAEAVELAAKKAMLARTEKSAADLDASIQRMVASLNHGAAGVPAAAHPNNPASNYPLSHPSRGGTER